MSHDGTSTTATVHKIKQEIDRLAELQAKELRNATFVGMTPEKAKEYDARREEIGRLVEQLASLEKSL